MPEAMLPAASIRHRRIEIAQPSLFRIRGFIRICTDIEINVDVKLERLSIVMKVIRLIISNDANDMISPKVVPAAQPFLDEQQLERSVPASC